MVWNIRRCAVKLLREPIVHFLVIGAMIFGHYEVRNGKAAQEPKTQSPSQPVPSSG